MSLKNGVVLHLGQVNFCGVQVLRRQNSPRLESSYYISLWNLSFDLFPDCIHVYNVRSPPFLIPSVHSQVSSMMSISWSA